MNPMWRRLSNETTTAGSSDGSLEVDWPPILCPICWATRFMANEIQAQCYYCGHVMVRRT
jgi:hypothetical protein